MLTQKRLDGPNRRAKVALDRLEGPARDPLGASSTISEQRRHRATPSSRLEVEGEHPVKKRFDPVVPVASVVWVTTYLDDARVGSVASAFANSSCRCAELVLIPAAVSASSGCGAPCLRMKT